jgi:hypothetical protein
VISGFCHEVAENCALLGYYTTISGKNTQQVVAISYHYSPHNNPEERSSQTQNTLMKMALLCVGIKL